MSQEKFRIFLKRTLKNINNSLTTYDKRTKKQQLNLRKNVDLDLLSLAKTLVKYSRSLLERIDSLTGELEERVQSFQEDLQQEMDYFKKFLRNLDKVQTKRGVGKTENQVDVNEKEPFYNKQIEKKTFEKTPNSNEAYKDINIESIPVPFQPDPQIEVNTTGGSENMEEDLCLWDKGTECLYPSMEESTNQGNTPNKPNITIEVDHGYSLKKFLSSIENPGIKENHMEKLGEESIENSKSKSVDINKPCGQRMGTKVLTVKLTDCLKYKAGINICGNPPLPIKQKYNENNKIYKSDSISSPRKLYRITDSSARSSDSSSDSSESCFKCSSTDVELNSVIVISGNETDETMIITKNENSISTKEETLKGMKRKRRPRKITTTSSDTQSNNTLIMENKLKHTKRNHQPNPITVSEEESLSLKRSDNTIIIDKNNHAASGKSQTNSDPIDPGENLNSSLLRLAKEGYVSEIEIYNTIVKDIERIYGVTIPHTSSSDSCDPYNKTNPHDDCDSIDKDEDYIRKDLDAKLKNCSKYNKGKGHGNKQSVKDLYIKLIDCCEP